MNFYNFITINENIIFYFLWNEKGNVIRTSFNSEITKNSIKQKKLEIENIFKNYFFKKIPINGLKFIFNSKLTDFEKQVLFATRKIPLGKTLTYSELAEKINRKKSYRAVGNALGKNPLPVIIPCHRVLAKSGLGGFTGGLYIKKYLLELEGIDLKSICKR